jgi:hypothetical protein
MSFEHLSKSIKTILLQWGSKGRVDIASYAGCYRDGYGFSDATLDLIIDSLMYYPVYLRTSENQANFLNTMSPHATEYYKVLDVTNSANIYNASKDMTVRVFAFTGEVSLTNWLLKGQAMNEYHSYLNRLDCDMPIHAFATNFPSWVIYIPEEHAAEHYSLGIVIRKLVDESMEFNDKIELALAWLEHHNMAKDLYTRLKVLAEEDHEINYIIQGLRRNNLFETAALLDSAVREKKPNWRVQWHTMIWC